MKKRLLIALCIAGLSGCAATPPAALDKPTSTTSNANVAGKISGDTVSILNFPPLPRWIADAKERERRYLPLLAELKRRNPEQDANAAIVRGEHYLLGEWVGFDDGGNVYWNKEQAGFGKTPKSLDDVAYTRVCKIHLLEGLIGQGSPPPGTHSSSIPPVYAQYQGIAQHYSERWNNIMTPACKAALQAKHAKQRDAATQKRQQAEHQWQQSQLRDYTFTLQRSCFCMEEVRTPMEVTVKNGVVVSALQLPEKKRSVTEFAITVDEVFAFIRSANATHDVDVKYHPQYGYPLAASKGSARRDGLPIADSGYGITISNLHAIPATPPTRNGTLPAVPKQGKGLPPSVEAAAQDVVSKLSAADKNLIRTSEFGELIRFHRTLGAGIRNDYGLYSSNYFLLADACNNVPKKRDDKGKPFLYCHPDEASAVILEAVWHKLQTNGKS